MKTNVVKSSLSDTLNMLPGRVLPKRARVRVEKLFQEMDQLLFLDERDELAVDRKSLIRIVSNKDNIPTSLRDIALLETSKHLGRRVKDIGRGRRITWRDGEKHGLPIHPLSLAELREWGITEKTATSDLADLAKERFPKLPAFWMNENSKELSDAVLQKFMENRTVWDCLVANLGWWAAITLVGGLVILLILLGSGVPAPVALIVTGFYQSVATTYFVAQCINNTEFQQR